MAYMFTASFTFLQVLYCKWLTDDTVVLVAIHEYVCHTNLSFQLEQYMPYIGSV